MLLFVNVTTRPQASTPSACICSHSHAQPRAKSTLTLTHSAFATHTHTHNTHDPRHIYSVSVLISWVEETSFSRIKNVRRLLMFFVQSFSRDCVLPINFIMPSIWICYAYCYTCNTICGYWMSEQSARVFDFRIVSMKQQATTNPTYKWRTLPWCIAINFPIYMCFALYILCISVECVATFGSKQVLNGSNDGSSGRYLSYYTATAL